ncbi:DUF6504 family protein [Luteococcus sp. OSA5]|uniref:DUF6504 family protein n=1 Tax=Luteococcus sp. OSA5 TaxID=3401630 RepID=UPI003B429B69
MRRCDESIEVRTGHADRDDAPSLFLWRNRLWRVLEVQSRWVEATPWWEQAGVRAARGDWGDGQEGGGLEAAVVDLEAESEVWRVEAADGRHASRGVYELAHHWGDGSWRLRAVVD